jgi:hypothetical protein
MDLSMLRSRFTRYNVILEPDRDVPEWWAGAPSVTRDPAGRFHLACRMREGDSPRGRRGYEVRILGSDDGLYWERIHAIRRQDVPIPGFERPALLRDPHSGAFKLYLCGPWQEGPWCIMKLDDVADPRQFEAASCRPVLRAEDLDLPGLVSLKDPFILHTQGQYHMLVIGNTRYADGHAERTFHFVSDDGGAWSPVGDGLAMDLGGWHNFYVRPGCVVPVGCGYLFVYEGSHYTWHDPGYNIATGLAFTLDLRTFTDLTLDEPLVSSTTPGDYRTWRYSHWLRVGDELWAYAEVARPNNTNEIRLFRLPMV